MYWEIVSVVMQVLQMVYYIRALDKYKDKLEDLSDWLKDTADTNKGYYKSFRDRDPSFYAYYQSLPGYSVCESNVKRSKGAGFHAYGGRLRKGINTVRGYSPLAKVQMNTLVSSEAVAISSVHRANTRMNERGHVDSRVVERWSAIVHAPVNVESYQSAAVTSVINDSFRTIKAMGQGFNSAGSALGTSLYGLLT